MAQRIRLSLCLKSPDMYVSRCRKVITKNIPTPVMYIIVFSITSLLVKFVPVWQVKLLSTFIALVVTDVE